MSIAMKKELDYTLIQTEKTVFVESDFYIPFEPKKASLMNRDKIISLRDDLRKNIKRLEVNDGEILFASYSENDKSRFYDVENMLFYNIGVSAFKECCKKQVAFMGDIEHTCSEDKKHSDIEERYFYSYQVLSTEDIDSMLHKREVVACWKNFPIDVYIPQFPARYYAAVRKKAADVKIRKVLENKCPYGISLDVTLPSKSTAMSIMKPLLDGVICAFHGETEGVEDTLRKLFDDTSCLLNACTCKLNVLGNRTYVSQYRGEGSFKWNPEDERLQFARITLRQGANAMLSGKIYEWGKE